MTTRSLPALVLIVLWLSSALRAQSSNASLSGRVTDGSGGVVPDATVTAIATATNGRRATTTNDSGAYSLPNLAPGPYRIEVEKEGFKKIVHPDVILHVQDGVDMDVALEIGSRAETLTVMAGAPMVNTQSGTVSTVVDRAFVEQVPLNGRSFQTLIMLTPGVVVTPTVFNDQGQFSVNGQRADA